MKPALWMLWASTAIGLALWTLLAWSVWALITEDPAWVDQLHAWAQQRPLGAWLNEWLESWALGLGQALRLLQHILHGLLPWLGGLLGVVWLAGSAFGLLLALLIHRAIRQTPAQVAQPSGAT